jgi:DNA-binding transcriptional LysR family regulator
MGLGLLPAIVISSELRQHLFKAVHWAGPSLDVTTHIVWHKDKWVSPAMAAFLELAQSQADEEPVADIQLEGTFLRLT